MDWFLDMSLSSMLAGLLGCNASTFSPLPQHSILSPSKLIYVESNDCCGMDVASKELRLGVVVIRTTQQCIIQGMPLYPICIIQSRLPRCMCIIFPFNDGTRVKTRPGKRNGSRAPTGSVSIQHLPGNEHIKQASSWVVNNADCVTIRQTEMHAYIIIMRRTQLSQVANRKTDIGKQLENKTKQKKKVKKKQS